MHTPPTQGTGGIADWTVKIRKLAEAASSFDHRDQRRPGWIQTLFRHLKEVTGKPRVSDIWPKLQLVIHGGTMFDHTAMSFARSWGRTFISMGLSSSEGFIATEDPAITP